MDLGIKDRVALVAAASKGLGFAAARELALEGARVFLCSRDEQRAAEAAQKIHEETGATAAGIGAGVTDDQAVERFVNLARERAGRIDILITNAGGPPAATFSQANLAFLASERASYITGVTLQVDGGWVRGLC